MAQIEIFNSKEKEKLIKELKEQFGINELPFLLLKSGKDKIRSFSGNLSTNEINELARNSNIETIGIYLLSEEKDGIRLSFSSTNINSIKQQISKNIIELDEKQKNEWLKGRDIFLDNNFHGFVVLKHNDDFIGCGKLSNGRIANFVPKERRIKG